MRARRRRPAPRRIRSALRGVDAAVLLRQRPDRVPEFPTLQGFPRSWKNELDGVLHSVRIAHRRLRAPAEWTAVDGIIVLH